MSKERSPDMHPVLCGNDKQLRGKDLMQVWTETKEDCLWLVYYLIFVGPLHALVVAFLEYRGKRVSTSKALTWIASLTVFSMLLPLFVRYHIQKSSPYRMLGVQRNGDKYAWAQVYAAWKQHFVDGRISQDMWMRLDAAYDMLYSNRIRRAYESWGPDFQVQTKDDMVFNLGMFYVLWSAGVYIATVGRKYKTGRDISIAALLVVLALELSVRFFNYDPHPYFLTQTTPFELVMLAHIVFPALLLGYNSYKRIIIVDMLKHKNDCLRYALRNNQIVLENLRGMKEEAIAIRAKESKIENDDPK